MALQCQELAAIRRSYNCFTSSVSSLRVEAFAR
jgi:hypothetical protein